ncbi:hypothetical protein HYPSUDRAFT_203642 [Hypholoma sublateritium FD-334 SS-4]|uniref:Uncharacterized protein n=1 Tax=Hypholoma sublateritium (strain FD-334 SS-4) TaxID=945553 RepID=A0A0D2L213_HYPSF|nr:hypothetical protein HYPSUDRAFT_203642 [Hypholoma sublateritium FD-334 SS-4]
MAFVSSSHRHGKGSPSVEVYFDRAARSLRERSPGALCASGVDHQSFTSSTFLSLAHDLMLHHHPHRRTHVCAYAARCPSIINALPIILSKTGYSAERHAHGPPFLLYWFSAARNERGGAPVLAPVLCPSYRPVHPLRAW